MLEEGSTNTANKYAEGVKGALFFPWGAFNVAIMTSGKFAPKKIKKTHFVLQKPGEQRILSEAD